MNKRFFHLIIVDESGSMSCIEKQTVSGINETIQSVQRTQRESEQTDHFITLTAFSSEGVRTLYDATPALQAEPINAHQYSPNGCTPLYDAIGNGILSLKRIVAPQDPVMVTIITDGEENCSSEFSLRQIHSLINEQKKQDWLFTFIGANIDVERASKDMGIDYSLAFEQDVPTTKKMFSTLSSLASKMSKRKEQHPDMALHCMMEDDDLKL